MLKRKISSSEMDVSKVKSKKRSGKPQEMDLEKKRELKLMRKMHDFSGDRAGKYVRLHNPGVSANKEEDKKKTDKKVKKLKKLKGNKIDVDNDIECNKILEELNFEKSCIISGINALFKILDHKKTTDNLLDLDTPIFLQLTSFKVPICPSRTLRLPLKHSLHEDDCTVCFIVSDVAGIIKKEHEKVSDYYENLFAEKGVQTKIHKILPLHELKTEYGEFEMKRKLLSTYDVFFVDGKISKYVSRHLGKIFRTKRRLPIPIGLEQGMALRMKYAMLRTSMNLHGHGNTFTVQIGHCNMKVEQIYENILSVCSKLIREFPGGWENVKVVNLKTDLSMAIPLYLSLRKPSLVKTPKIKGKRPKAYQTYTDELSTKNNSKVTVHPSGSVVVERLTTKKRKLHHKE